MMNMEESDQPKVLCRHCRLEIPRDAKICTHCSSPQDWRIYFSISNTALALLTALLSVITISIPPIYNLIHTPRSSLLPPIITIDGTIVRTFLTNNGDAAGVFVKAFVDSDYLAAATKIRLRGDSSPSIAPGSNVLLFDVVPLLTEDQSYRISIEMIELMVSNKSAPRTDIVFHFGESDGSLRVTRLSLDAELLFELMRANSDRCSAIEKPDFYNGCIGP